MINHEAALQAALIARLRGDDALDALVAGRVWDGEPAKRVFPYVTVSRVESRPVRADGGGVEQVLTLTGHSRFEGLEETRAISAAIRAALHEADLTADGVRVVNPRVTFADVFGSPEGRRSHAVVRVRAVTEEIEA
ncbi:DUF3168 domain-containing protein [Brevundimonas sp.]|uniref:DUF3168 domain-containing protein n=1 Tax=Brevundimonas sp. TaxID=1871086 RepID=UPI00391DCF38